MRDNEQRRNPKGNREPRGDRPPSTWKPEEKFSSGRMSGEITSRPGRDGKQYSCTISRLEQREGKEFFSRFWRPPQDLRDVIKLCQEMLTWYECDDAEQKQKQEAS